MGQVHEAFERGAGRVDRAAARVLRRHRSLVRRPCEPVAEGARRAAGARRSHGGLPRPHRQRRRDHRPHPGERAHDDHVLCVRRPAADPAPLRPRRRAPARLAPLRGAHRPVRPDRRCTRHRGAVASNVSRPRAATRSPSWSIARSARPCSSGPPARARTACGSTGPRRTPRASTDSQPSIGYRRLHSATVRRRCLEPGRRRRDVARLVPSGRGRRPRRAEHGRPPHARSARPVAGAGGGGRGHRACAALDDGAEQRAAASSRAGQRGGGR